MPERAVPPPLPDKPESSRVSQRAILLSIPILMKPTPPNLQKQLMHDILTKRNHHLLKVIRDGKSRGKWRQNAQGGALRTH